MAGKESGWRSETWTIPAASPQVREEDVCSDDPPGLSLRRPGRLFLLSCLPPLTSFLSPPPLQEMKKDAKRDSGQAGVMKSDLANGRASPVTESSVRPCKKGAHTRVCSGLGSLRDGM